MTEKEKTLADLLLDKAIKWTSDAVFNESDRLAVDNIVVIYGHLVSSSQTRACACTHTLLGNAMDLMRNTRETVKIAAEMGLSQEEGIDGAPDTAPDLNVMPQEAKPAKATSRKKEKPAAAAETPPAEPEPEKPIVEEKVEEQTPPVTEERVLAAAEEVLPESTPITLEDLTKIYWKWHGKYSTTDTEKWLKLKKRMEEIRDSFGAASLSAIKPESLAAAHALFADIQDPA